MILPVIREIFKRFWCRIDVYVNKFSPSEIILTLGVGVEAIKPCSFKSEPFFVSLDRRVVISYHREEFAVIRLQILSVMPEAS